MRGGQVSIEYLLVTGFSFMLIAPLFIVFYTQSDAIRADLTEAQAHSAALALVESAQRVYYQGPPSRETVSITIPKDIQNITIYNDSVVFRVITPQQYDLLVPSPVPLVPESLNSTAGPTDVRVDATASGVLYSIP